MTDPVVNLSLEQAAINANLLVLQNVWKQRFAQFGKNYDAAYVKVSGKLKDASKSQEKALISMIAKIADMAVKPFGIYGAIAQVALAGLSELAKSTVHPGSAINLPSPSALSYSKDLDVTSEKMFEPLLRQSAKIAMLAKDRAVMEFSDFKRSKSVMLSSPIWYPPSELPDGVITRRLEIALWAAYFDSLRASGYPNHQLHFLDDIVDYLLADRVFDPGLTTGWNRYPKNITQGGPGDWVRFLYDTRRFWQTLQSNVVDQGWLLPLPQIPENAKIQKSVNWTAPKPVTFKAPTKSGKATIIVQSVDMDLLPSIDWKDIPELNKVKK